MSGASFQEFFLLLIIGLVVLGPKRLPQVANQIGSWLGQARRMTRMMKRQLEDEINFDLDSLNVKKQLGLDSDSTPPDGASVSKPSYVHTPPKPVVPKATRDSEEESEAASEDEAEVELPDDYSPAHAAEEPGTGVGDDTDYIDDDELEPVRSVQAESVEESVADKADDKKKTA